MVAILRIGYAVRSDACFSPWGLGHLALVASADLVLRPRAVIRAVCLVCCLCQIETVLGTKVWYSYANSVNDKRGRNVTVGML